jgi:hypothetical protein
MATQCQHTQAEQVCHAVHRLVEHEVVPRVEEKMLFVFAMAHLRQFHAILELPIDQNRHAIHLDTCPSSQTKV